MYLCPHWDGRCWNHCERHAHFSPAGTRRLCNVRLMLDMTSDRRWILVENENRVDINIWRWLNVGFWLHNLKTTKSQRQLTSVLDINLTLTLDVGFTLDFGHLMSQPKFNQIPTSYDVVCLFVPAGSVCSKKNARLCHSFIHSFILTETRRTCGIHIWIDVCGLIFTDTSPCHDLI